MHILPAARTGLDVLGEHLGRSMTNAMPQMYENQRRQMSKEALENAFGQINPEEDFMTQLRKIAPTMLTTPGGAQAMEALLPLLGQRAQNKAYTDFLNSQRSGGGTGQQPGQAQQMPGQELPNSAQIQAAVAPPKPQAPTSEDYYRNPQAYASPESLFPERANELQETPEMSAAQVRDSTLDLMQASMAQGKPLSFPEAQNAIVQQNALIQQQNERIRNEKKNTKAANAELASGMVQRAQNSGLIKEPEDATVAEKLSLEARRLPDANQQWQFVRSGLRKFDDAKSRINTSADVAGPLTNLYRHGVGTYKGKSALISSVQPAIDEYKKYGLYDELRRDLSESLGLGPEDVETAIFPMDAKAKKEVSGIPRNPRNILNKFGEEPIVMKEMVFPGEGFEIEGKQFEDFKNHVEKILNDNPKINLVTLRGNLNQEKRYAWQDISKAIEQLAAEDRFIPDAIQEKQLGIIGHSPAPGLLELFKNFWTGTK